MCQLNCTYHLALEHSVFEQYGIQLKLCVVTRDRCQQTPQISIAYVLFTVGSVCFSYLYLRSGLNWLKVTLCSLFCLTVVASNNTSRDRLSKE